MLGNFFTIREIFTTILFITMGFSQVTIKMANVDTDAGTLDIYMSNTAGCSYCADSTLNKYTNDWYVIKKKCEDPISAQGSDTTWVSYENITEAECWNTCSGAITEGICTEADDPAVTDFPQPDNEADCLDPAKDNNATGTPGDWVASSSPDDIQPMSEARCSDPNNDGVCIGADDPAVTDFWQPHNEADCLDPAGDNNATGTQGDWNQTGTPGIWSQSATVPSNDGYGGWWFDGEVGGFQFELTNIEITGASGGSASAAGFSVSTIGINVESETTVPCPLPPCTFDSQALAFSITGATIPVGSEEVLTQITFTSVVNTDICFGEDTGSNGNTVISGTDTDNTDLYVGATWGECYCVDDADEDGHCDSLDNCVNIANPDQLDTDGDGGNCSGAMDDDVLLDPQPETQAECIDFGELSTVGTWSIVDGGGDLCDDWYYDANNDQDGDGIAECTLTLAECNDINNVQEDNCPETANPDQVDIDGDDIGDDCDTCPYDDNNDKIDNDGVCYCSLDDCSAVTDIIDNCRSVPNAGQVDIDGDGVGDLCDKCPNDPNGPTDCDGNAATLDVQCDADGDGVGDVCDNCTAVPNAGQVDIDEDGVGDLCDNCPADANAPTGYCDGDPVTPDKQCDADSDFVGDACDACADFDDLDDADGDGMPDGCDDCADTVSGATVDSTGCEATASISQIGTDLPAEFSISQNFPNPFNPVTSIAFDVAEMDEVSLVVYDLTGKEVATLVSGTYTPGIYKVEWNAVNNAGDGISSGMYIYRYFSSEKAITRKMLYLK